MKDELATKIAAMVSELGKLRTSAGTEPSDAQARTMRGICSAQHAQDALHLALGMVLETATPVAAPLVDLMMLCAACLAPLHKDNADRKVTRGDILRRIADASDEEDEATSTLKRLMEVIRGPRVPAPSDSGDDKPGSN
jgi:hypothetical protein